MRKAQADLGIRAKNAEIAFFGGSFTAIDRGYMLSLLDAAKEFEDSFAGIRVSTRPDCVDDEVLDILQAYHVTAIELGAQSMCDSVLLLNERGHTAEDVISASKRIQCRGISLGLQMMTGLYDSDFEKDLATARSFIALRPDTVRIYPTVVMKQTALEKYYLEGRYQPYTLEESVALCANLIQMFEAERIPIIRLGLHYSDSLMQNGYTENYHPAFREMCESKLFYDSFLEKSKKYESKRLTVVIHPKSLSKFYGQKKSNFGRLSALGYEITVRFDDTLEKYELRIEVSD